MRVPALTALLLLAGALLPAGCGSDPPRDAEPTVGTAAIPARGTDRVPASAAGGACRMLDYYAVEQLIGVRFGVSASARHDTTDTCVLQKSGVGYPDLTLAVTPMTVPATGFAAAAPPGATELAGVGQAAYQLVRPAPTPGSAGSGSAGSGSAGSGSAVSGPAIEIGWLTRTNQLMVVRYRLAGDQAQTEAEVLLPRVIDLAVFLDPA